MADTRSITVRVLLLRRAGLKIESIEERAAGPYPGRHARHVLRSAVEGVSIGGREATT